MVPAAASAMRASWWTAPGHWGDLVATLAASMAAEGEKRHAPECASLLVTATWLGLAGGAASTRPATASLARRLGLRWLILPLPYEATATEVEAVSALQRAWGGHEGRAMTPGGDSAAEVSAEAGTQWANELRLTLKRDLSPAGQSLVATLVSAASAPARLTRVLRALGAFVARGGGATYQHLAEGGEGESALARAYRGRRMDSACAHPGPVLADVAHMLAPAEAFPSDALVTAAQAACRLVQEGWQEGAGVGAEWASLAGGALWLVHILRMVLCTRGEAASLAREEEELVKSLPAAAAERRPQIGADAADALAMACQHIFLRTQWVSMRWDAEEQ